jgi:hypothetical protein
MASTAPRAKAEAAGAAPTVEAARADDAARVATADLRAERQKRLPSPWTPELPPPSAAALAATDAVRDDDVALDPEEASTQRAARVLRATAELCGAPPSVSIAALVYLVVFYARPEHAHASDAWADVVPACLLLASKIEEKPTRVSDVVNAMQRVMHPLRRDPAFLRTEAANGADWTSVRSARRRDGNDARDGKDARDGNERVGGRALSKTRDGAGFCRRKRVERERVERRAWTERAGSRSRSRSRTLEDGGPSAGSRGFGIADGAARRARRGGQVKVPARGDREAEAEVPRASAEISVSVRGGAMGSEDADGPAERREGSSGKKRSVARRRRSRAEVADGRGNRARRRHRGEGKGCGIGTIGE